MVWPRRASGEVFCVGGGRAPFDAPLRLTPLTPPPKVRAVFLCVSAPVFWPAPFSANEMSTPAADAAAAALRPDQEARLFRAPAANARRLGWGAGAASFALHGAALAATLAALVAGRPEVDDVVIPIEIAASLEAPQTQADPPQTAPAQPDPAQPETAQPETAQPEPPPPAPPPETSQSEMRPADERVAAPEPSPAPPIATAAVAPAPPPRQEAPRKTLAQKDAASEEPAPKELARKDPTRKEPARKDPARNDMSRKEPPAAKTPPRHDSGAHPSKPHTAAARAHAEPARERVGGGGLRDDFDPAAYRAIIAHAVSAAVGAACPSAGAGRVVVALAIGGSGRISGVSLARASGNSALDAAALAAVRRAGPFPAPAGRAGVNVPVAVNCR